MPKGILLYQSLPWVFVPKMVSSLLLSDRCMCKNALKASPFVKYLVSASLWAISSTVAWVWFSLMMALFSGMQSRQGLTSLDSFTGYVVLLTHGVGSICVSRMSSVIMLSRATQMASSLSVGTLHLACCTGAMVGSILMVYSPFKLPILSKEFGYIAVSCSLSVILTPTGYGILASLCTEATLSVSQPWSHHWGLAGIGAVPGHSFCKS